ncbi:unnamed protein product [Pedinophyceae sp. YPF-701]|nr:unnamed protein product [Pedinophyceae sp. YPF-701]
MADGLERPKRRFVAAEKRIPQMPAAKDKVEKRDTGALFASAASDDQFRAMISARDVTAAEGGQRGKGHASTPRTLAVLFGSAWCHHCHTTFERMYEDAVRGVKRCIGLGYGDVAYLKETCDREGIEYTPTVAFYRDGVKVDEVIGPNEQRLADRLWLHSTRKGDRRYPT